MHHRYSTWCLLKIVFCVWIGGCLALLGWCIPVHASYTSDDHSHSTHSPNDNPTIQVLVGFDKNAAYRTNYWTPVYVTLQNHHTDFHGTLVVSTFAGTDYHSALWKFEEPVTLPKDTQQRLTLNIPLYETNIIPRGIITSLLNTQGKTVATQTATNGNEIKTGDILIGVLSSPGKRFDPLNVLTLPNQDSVTLSALNSSTFPDKAAVLDNFDVIVLDDFNSASLNPNQFLALQTWVNRGGILVEIGGSQWQQTLTPLPSTLQPVDVLGTITLPKGAQFLSTNSPMIQTDDQQVLATPAPDGTIVSIATPSTQAIFSKGETELSYGVIPLIVQAHEGQGVISYVGIDLANKNMVTWAGASDFWQLVLLYAFGDRLLIPNTSDSYNSGPGQLLTHIGVLNMLQPQMSSGPWIILLFLLGYALILGPLRFFIQHKLQRPHWWSWRIILSCIAVFSLLAYGLAFYQRQASITDNSISLVQVNQDGSSAHVTTYSGVFVPDRGDFTLHTPVTELTQPISSQYLHDQTEQSNTQATVGSSRSTTAFKLQGLSPWTLHYISGEQDLQLDGRITTNLSISNNKLKGTIKNTLLTTLSDLYVLLPHSIIPLGHLTPGETLNVNLTPSSVPAYKGKTLADQIAEHNGLPDAYFPYTHNQQPQTALQRHIAFLSALEGAGVTFSPCQDSCKTHTITSRNTIFVTNGRVPNPSLSGYEPLMLSGTPATLIGWMDTPITDNVTINGWQPLGQHESFFQMPLSVGASNPSDAITGQLVNAQSFDAEQPLASIYTLTSGSLTFQLTLPDSAYTQTKSSRITVPDLWADPLGTGTGQLLNPSHMQIQLYNWQTGKWDTKALNGESFTISNQGAYTGTDDHILLQISNQDTNQGKLYFGAPYLRLNP